MIRTLITPILATVYCLSAHALQSTGTVEQEQPLNSNPLRISGPETSPSSESEQTQPTSGSKAGTQNGVIEIEDTIRIKREQPKVLSIVPWQPPGEKTSLPSPFLKRIEQDFMPLDRAEFTRKVQHFERVSGAEEKSK